MRILILGVGDAFTRKHFGTSAVIETGSSAADGAKRYTLIDCPDLIHRALHDACAKSGWAIDASRIDDVILTHLHGDHCNGLESFGFHRRILRLSDARLPRPRLHASQAVAERLWSRLAPAMDQPFGDTRPSTLEDYFEVRILTPGREQEVGDGGGGSGRGGDGRLTVRCRTTKHSVPTLGLLVSHAGATLGWSGDTPFEQAHIDWLSAADVIVHESNLGPAHTPIEALNAQSEALRAKMRLIHLPDDFDPRTTDIAILREGEVIHVRV